MGLPASPRIILPVLGFFLLALFLWDSGSTGTMSSSTSSSSASFDPSKALSLSVSTTSSSSHPTIKLSVTNTASSPVTFLRWNTPLDPMALKVGVLSLTAQGSSEPAQLAIIAVRRMMPPQADQFVTLGPGETATNEQELKPPVVMSEELGIKDKTVKVQAIGEWSHVWPLGHEDVINHHREKVGGAESDGAARGSFMSEPLDVQF